MQRSMRITMLLPAVDKLRQQGLIDDELLASLGLDENTIRDFNFRMPIEDVDRLLAVIKESLNCPELGLLAGSKFELRNFGLLGYMLSYCDNLGELCELAPRYYRYLSSDRAPQLEMIDSLAIARHQISSGQPEEERTRAELFVSAILRCARVLSSEAVQIKKIEFEFPRPQYAELYSKYFEADEISFNHKITSLYFDKEYLKTKLDFPDQSMKQQLRDQLDSVLNVEKNSSYREKVTQLLMSQDQGFAFNLSMAEIASMINMTAKTLSRRLSDEGISFKQLHNDVRHQYAQQLLSGSSKIDAIALELGYADRSAFDRSFSRIEGESPAVFRRGL